MQACGNSWNMDLLSGIVESRFQFARSQFRYCGSRSMDVSPSEPLNQLVSDLVRSLRRSKGLTLEQLASLSGVSRSMLSEIERGGANPTLGVAFRIAQAFGMSLGDFVSVPAT